MLASRHASGIADGCWWWCQGQEQADHDQETAQKQVEMKKRQKDGQLIEKIKHEMVAREEQAILGTLENEM